MIHSVYPFNQAAPLRAVFLCQPTDETHKTSDFIGKTLTANRYLQLIQEKTAYY